MFYKYPATCLQGLKHSNAIGQEPCTDSYQTRDSLRSNLGQIKAKSRFCQRGFNQNPNAHYAKGVWNFSNVNMNIPIQLILNTVSIEFTPMFMHSPPPPPHCLSVFHSLFLFDRALPPPPHPPLLPLVIHGQRSSPAAVWVFYLDRALISCFK